MRTFPLVTFGRRRRQTVAVAVAAFFMISMCATVAAPRAWASTPVTITANGQTSGSQNFDVSAADDGAGNVTGTVTLSGPSFFNGSVACIYVEDDNAIVRASSPDGFGGTTWVTVYLHDASGFGNSVAIEGPVSGLTPTCPTTPPTGGLPLLQTGSVTIATGGSSGGPANVTALGSVMQFGSSTSFDITAADDGAGNVTGAFDLTGSTTLSGTVTCVSVTGNTAVVGGEGFMPGAGTVWITMYLVDAAPGAGGDRIDTGTPTNMPGSEPTCTGSPSSPPTAIQSGDIVIGGGSVQGTSDVSVVGSGFINRGFGSGDSFDVVAIADGAGAISGTVRMKSVDRTVRERTGRLPLGRR